MVQNFLEYIKYLKYINSTKRSNSYRSNAIFQKIWAYKSGNGPEGLVGFSMTVGMDCV